jgi:hypothetical protein
MSFDLTNAKTAKLSLNSGKIVELSAASELGSVTISVGEDALVRISLNKDSVTLEKTGKGKVTVGDDGVTMEMTGGAKVSVTDTEAKLSSGNDSVSVSGTSGITLQFAGGQMKAGPLSINQAGVVQMG